MPQPDLTCVVYHHVSEKPDPFVRHLGITTTPSNLENHIAHYKRHFNIIDIDTALSGLLPPNPLLITFDDSFKTTLEVAAPILKKNDIPSAVFLNPGMITDKAFCLDNLLSYLVSKSGAGALANLIPEATETPISVGEFISLHVSQLSLQDRNTLKQRTLEILRANEADLWDESGLYLSSSDIKRFSSFGMEVGNHTTSHMHCRNLTNDDMAKEITNSKKVLEDLAKNQVRTFAFPYGNKQDATSDVLNILRKTKHQMIFLVHARSNKKRPASDLWYRVSLTNEPKNWLFPKLRLLPKVRSLIRGTS